jgi:hypothetical protein
LSFNNQFLSYGLELRPPVFVYFYTKLAIRGRWDKGAVPKIR